MDINTLRGISTILVMIVFVCICLWAYSKGKKRDFDDAANLPFADDEIADRTLNSTDKRTDQRTDIGTERKRHD